MNDLPYELLSAILQEAAELNIQQGPRYTYGLSQAPEPLQTAPMQHVVRGQLSPDTLRWTAVENVRQVCRQWHDWAAEYALENLYISRWRGSERWMQSRTLAMIRTNPSSVAVYRDPHHSLKQMLQLFEANPALALCVRRLWFDGYYGAETTAMIFRILRLCNNIDYVTLPWTALRYGNVDDWSRLLGRNEQHRSISSLELLAVDLKQSQIYHAANQVDKKPLNSPRVNFSGLKRLKIFGHSNFMPLTDDDLFAIAQSAANLQEIHITGTASVTTDGIEALADSSNETLEIIEHSPLTANGFEHPDPTPLRSRKDHLCRKILRCPRLRNLSLSLPTLCEDLFSNDFVKWSGEMQIRTSTVCGRHPLSLKTSPKVQIQFWRILDAARSLTASREREGVQLDIEIFVDGWIFEPRRFLVHGNLDVPIATSQGAWPSEESPSSKGPYGQTGLYGKDEGPYVSVSEVMFRDGLEKQYVRL
ncbi:hypothetical protein N7G274_003162 [Stereocaulon virgatum]|uniref:F-box domain-containing protein n=1 Tax=Stereocaulon virgatum TaxID=373712 RepID=A0ABR4AF59_9LECA